MNKISKGEAKRLPDIKAADGSLTTDGCGMIRESTAKLIRDKHGLETSTSGERAKSFSAHGLRLKAP